LFRYQKEVMALAARNGEPGLALLLRLQIAEGDRYAPVFLAARHFAIRDVRSVQQRGTPNGGGIKHPTRSKERLTDERLTNV
jgi:hypothetical protein